MVDIAKVKKKEYFIERTPKTHSQKCRKSIEREKRAKQNFYLTLYTQVHLACTIPQCAYAKSQPSIY